MTLQAIDPRLPKSSFALLDGIRKLPGRSGSKPWLKGFVELARSLGVLPETVEECLADWVGMHKYRHLGKEMSAAMSASVYSTWFTLYEQMHNETNGLPYKHPFVILEFQDPTVATCLECGIAAFSSVEERQMAHWFKIGADGKPLFKARVISFFDAIDAGYVSPELGFASI